MYTLNISHILGGRRGLGERTWAVCGHAQEGYISLFIPKVKYLTKTN